MDLSVIDRAMKYAHCGAMAGAAGGYIGTGVVTLWAGGSGLVPLTTGALMLGSALQACSEQPMGENPNAGGPQSGQRPGDCWELDNCCGTLWMIQPDEEGGERNFGPAWKILSVDTRPSAQEGYAPETKVNYLDCNGDVQESGWAVYPEKSNYTLRGDGDCSCKNDGTSPINDVLPPGADDPISYRDPVTNCNYNLTLQGFAQETEGGPSMPVWLMEGSDAPEGRADTGGRMGGCNWPPVIVYDPGGPNGPYPPIPWLDGLDWKQLLANAAAGAAGRLLADALKALFDAKIPEAEMLFVAPCDKDDKGKPEFRRYLFEEQNYQSRVLSQQAVLMTMIQQHLDWKTPVCFGKNEKGAYARSITFESNENTDNGNSRCTKRFGYRSNSPCHVEQLYEYWRDFVWDTGPVIVGHRGSALGNPQVWAASVAEGKRVIQHAGREAGVDPDKAGEWTIGSVNSPRYGVSHTVRLKQIQGVWQATARQGPSPRPEMVETFPAL